MNYMNLSVLGGTTTMLVVAIFFIRFYRRSKKEHGRAFAVALIALAVLATYMLFQLIPLVISIPPPGAELPVVWSSAGE